MATYDYDLATVLPQQLNRYDWIVSQDEEENAYAQMLDDLGEGSSYNRFRARKLGNACPNCEAGTCTGRPAVTRRVSCDTTGYSTGYTTTYEM